LLAARYERTTDNCGCFSFQNFTFQIMADRPIAKKKIPFLFSEKTGFKARYEKRYYPVEFHGLSNTKKTTHLPDVTKRLIQVCYFADGKGPAVKPPFPAEGIVPKTPLFLLPGSSGLALGGRPYADTFCSTLRRKPRLSRTFTTVKNDGFPFSEKALYRPPGQGLILWQVVPCPWTGQYRQ
jgi:hypothetical protein